MAWWVVVLCCLASFGLGIYMCIMVQIWKLMKEIGK